MGAILSTVTDAVWSYTDMVRNTICHYCNSERLNPWYSCNRRSAMINLHPGLCLNRRQHYFIMNVFAKYCAARDPEIQYAGHPNTRSSVREFQFPDKTLPKPMQTRKYICHGKSNCYIKWNLLPLYRQWSTRTTRRIWCWYLSNIELG